MSTAVTIAVQEWRYWSRTKLATVVALLAVILICISVYATFSQITNEKHTRETLQNTTEQTFRDQPARHPHRMVHYGHYVVRTPTSLAALDPGVDPYTGTVMFLEGHRQNSATFSPSYGSAQAGPFARLTPALSYQLLVPLVLIVMGFGVVARERESATDRQLVTSGISPVSIWFGKTLALSGVALIFLLPMLLGVILSGSELSIGFGFLLLYVLYMLIWVFIITAVSTWSQRTSASLFVLLIIWLTVCTLLPRLAANVASTNVMHASQIETDMQVIMAMRSAGDSHNANDPAFEKLKASLLAQYQVEKVEDLPVNFRGVVAYTSEADLNQVMNEFAEKRMASETAQSQTLNSFAIASPFIALQSASSIAAGTDGSTHHRFLREAEAVRYQFVQGLNKVHEEKLDYTDDINRSIDESSSLRARVDSDNWQAVLQDFRFEADSAQTRFTRLISSYVVMFIWLLIFCLIGYLGACRLPEVDNG